MIPLVVTMLILFNRGHSHPIEDSDMDTIDGSGSGNDWEDCYAWNCFLAIQQLCTPHEAFLDNYKWLPSEATTPQECLTYVKTQKFGPFKLIAKPYNNLYQSDGLVLRSRYNDSFGRECSDVITLSVYQGYYSWIPMEQVNCSVNENYCTTDQTVYVWTCDDFTLPEWKPDSTPFNSTSIIDQMNESYRAAKQATLNFLTSVTEFVDKTGDDAAKTFSATLSSVSQWFLSMFDFISDAAWIALKVIVIVVIVICAIASYRRYKHYKKKFMINSIQDDVQMENTIRMNIFQ